MTVSEFKAWFDGYMENIPGHPDERQFARIKEQISELTAIRLAATNQLPITQTGISNSFGQQGSLTGSNLPYMKPDGRIG